MIKNEQLLFPIFEKLYNKIITEDFVIDKSGVKIAELIGEKIVLNPDQPILDFGIKKTNIKYCEKELAWYLSQDLNIEGWVDDVQIWKQVADTNGYINSNYGWCIFSSDNFNQYENCKNELISNSESRRACMIYTRPEMWVDYNKNGKSDFICTDGVQCFIRNNKLIYIIKQRSCDLIYGALNDFWWHCFVYNKLYNELKEYYSDLQIGEILYFPFSLHVYSRHFELIEKIYKEFKCD